MILVLGSFFCVDLFCIYPLVVSISTEIERLLYAGNAECWNSNEESVMYSNSEG